MASSIRNFAKQILPMSHPAVIAGIRRYRDLQTLPVRFSRARQEELRAKMNRCRNFDELFLFARDELRGGALQNLEEIQEAIEYIGAARPRVFCEIGTANGGTNFLIAHSLSSIETIVAVDLYIMNVPVLRALLRPTQRLHLFNGSSYNRATVERVRRTLRGQPVDLLFIDGDHRFEGVKQDLLLYAPLMRDGGLIMFHDIIPDHGSRFGGLP